MSKPAKSLWLIDRKLPCIECDYDLFQLAGPVVACPECGEINDLRLPEQWKSFFNSHPHKQETDMGKRYEGPLTPTFIFFYLGIMTLIAVWLYPNWLFLIFVSIDIVALPPYFRMLKTFVQTERRFGSNWVQILLSLFLSHGTFIFPVLIMYASYRVGHMYTWYVEFYIVSCLASVPISGWLSVRVLNSYQKYFNRKTTPHWMRYCKAIRLQARESRRKSKSRLSR